MRKTFEQMALSNCATANTLALIGDYKNVTTNKRT